MMTNMNQEIGKGTLLVAMPMLLDPNFRQTVVLLCEHGAEGSLGVVINRPTQMEASDLIKEFPTLARAGSIFSGGPVAKNAMLILYRDKARPDVPDMIDENGHRVLPDVFLAKDLDRLQTPESEAPEKVIRCFIGYAGWAPGQLEAEMKTGAWHLLPGDSGLIFGADPESLWQEMMRRIGGKWEIYGRMPREPGLN